MTDTLHAWDLAFDGTGALIARVPDVAGPRIAQMPAPQGAARIGCVWGLVDRTEAAQIGTSLLVHDDLRGAPDLPWASALTRPDGTVVAAVSPACRGGLFWSAAPDVPSGHPEVDAVRLIAGDDLGAVVRGRTTPTTLDAQFIRDYAALRPPPDTTPYAEVRRISAGFTAVWSPDAARSGAAPQLVPWCAPGASAWGRPHREGPGTPEQYLATFDAAVDRLVQRGEPLYSTLSGGLDSSFVVASLVRHATRDNPVHALCHSPHPSAGLGALGNWDPDDFPIASAMAERYPGRIVMHRVVSDPDASSLSLCAEYSARSWSPVFNPGNQVWMAEMARRAAAGGASRIFHGTNGNSAFSADHLWGARYYLRRADVPGLVSLVAPSAGHGVSVARAARLRLATPILGPWLRPLRNRMRGVRPGEDGRTGYFRAAGLPVPPAPPSVLDRREAYLAWLSGDSALGSALAFGAWDTPWVDPFTSGEVLTLAATMTAREWVRGPATRGYARLLGEGRVPDSIRLRTRRGGQAWDSWFRISRQRDRYAAELDLIADTPVMRDLVDLSQLRATFASLPWDGSATPSLMPIAALERVVHLSSFVRATHERLAALPAAGGQSQAD